MSIHIHSKADKGIHGTIRGLAEDGRFCQADIGSGITTCTLEKTNMKQMAENIKLAQYPTRATFNVQTNRGNCTLVGELKDNQATILTNTCTCGFQTDLSSCPDQPGNPQCQVFFEVKNQYKLRNPNRIMPRDDYYQHPYYTPKSTPAPKPSQIFSNIGFKSK